MRTWKIFSLCFMVFLLSFNVMAQGQFLPVANIIKIQGTAFLNKDIAKVGSEISEGMIIKLKSPKDFVDIKYQNGHIVRINGGEVIVKELNPKSNWLHIVKGKVFNLVKALTPDEKYIISTKRASFGVRGTQFYVNESSKQSYLCVCEGVVKATNDKDKSELDIGKNQDLFVASKKAFKMTNASDAMINQGKSVFKELSAL